MVGKVLKWIGNIILALMVVIIAISVVLMIQSKKNPGAIPSIAGFRPMTVLSGSMVPVFNPGDLIVAKTIDPQTVKKGDIITFDVDSRTVVTHRVVDIVHQNGKIYFRTKGDANNVADPDLVRSTQLVGEYTFKIPYAGYLSSFARSTKGFILLIVIPIILLVGGEIKSLLSEAAKEDKNKLSPEGSKKA